MSKTYDLKAAGDKAGLEIIQDRKSEKYAVRSRLYHEDGTRMVRYWPDPCEFTHTLAEARGICEAIITRK